MAGNHLQDICLRTTRSLWSSGRVSVAPDQVSPRIVFPEYRDGSRRVSEQEARILFCSEMERTGYCYAVEAPTKSLYTFQGATPQSALTDLVIYRRGRGRLVRVVNVEFKAHNPGQPNFSKDIEKLVREKCPGCWFHLLANTNRGTMPSLRKKFRQALINAVPAPSWPIDLLFWVVVLDKQITHISKYRYRPAKGAWADTVEAWSRSPKAWSRVDS